MSDEIKAQIVSPQVDGDQVTFRMRAPKATEVAVVGIEGQSRKLLKKNERGIWELKLDGLKPELYSYSFEVDGTRVTDPSNRNVKKWLSCNSMFEIKGGLLHEQKDVPHGDLIEMFYKSSATKSQRNALVYLPPGYEATKEYPLLFLLHGFGDDFLAWKEVGRAHFILDNLISEKKIKPCVVVMPYGHPLPINLRREFDDYAGSNLEKMNQDLMGDLLPAIRKKYSVSKAPKDNAIVGLSMGGGQSIEIGLLNRSSFAKIGGFSSAAPQGAEEQLDVEFKDLLVDTDQTNSKIELFWIGCGKEDFLFERNNKFVDWLKKKSIKHEYSVTDGGHDWMVWRKYLATFLIKSFPAQ